MGTRLADGDRAHGAQPLALLLVQPGVSRRVEIVSVQVRGKRTERLFPTVLMQPRWKAFKCLTARSHRLSTLLKS
jgi:hypothetical protein